MERGGFVYILASRRNGTVYLGVTSDLVRRFSQHREGITGGFVTRYTVFTLVWFEVHSNIEVAIAREKAMKEWRRAWKIELIEATNPHWVDLAPGLGFASLAQPPKQRD